MSYLSMRAAALVPAAAASWAYWSAVTDGGPAGLDFDGGTLARLDAGHAALVLWEDAALVSATTAGPGVAVRRTERDGRAGLQATAEVQACPELLVHVVPEDPAVEHWAGWNRSFPALVSAYARAERGGPWRLLATLRAKTSAFSSSALRTAELRALRPFGAGHVWLRQDGGLWEPVGGAPALPGAVELPSTTAELPAAQDGDLQPFGGGWGAEADRWALGGGARCRPPEEPPLKLPDPKTWPRPPWCGEPAGTVLPALHLWWHLPEAQRGAAWLYNTLTVEQSAPFTFFMALGWRGGYFGVQEHANSADRYVLFSVWDGAEATEVVAVGSSAEAARFGNEGTGVSAHARFPWKVGAAVEFAVHADAEPDGFTTYSGYVYDAPAGVWRLLAKLRTRACGGASSGLLQQPSSFLEVWTPSAECAHRRARYGPAYWRAPGAESEWREAESVHLTATCGLGDVPAELANLACPATGLDAGPDFMAVGGAVRNAARDAFGVENGTLKVRTLSPRALPALLHAPLPLGDGSPGLGQRPRPLLRWGSSRNKLEPFGQAHGERPVCPWYVTDCDGIH